MAIPFSPKLRLAPLWPALAALVLGAVASTLLLPGVVEDESARDLEQTLPVLEPALPRPEADARGADPTLQKRVGELVSGTTYRLTLIRRDGTVLADSARTLEQVQAMENHGERPEVLGALASGSGRGIRRSVTTGEPTAYAARAVTAEDGTVWIVRLARPIRTLDRIRSHLLQVTWMSALVAAVVALFVSGWLTRTLFRPLAGLIEAAGRIGAGDYEGPVAMPEQEELARLGHALVNIQKEARRQIAAVEAERDHLRSTVASMSEGVLVVDLDGHSHLVNPAFRSLFGLPPDADPGDALDLAREPRLYDLVAGVLESSEPAAIEIERAEPAPRTIALLASPLSGGGGAVVVARDLTEVERLNRVRKDFVANVSHELKTPLSAIRGFAETLVDGAVDEPETALRFSRRILDQCRRLGDLLDDLLTLSRLERDRAQRVRERVDLRRLAAEAAELVAGAAQAKSVAIEVEAGEALPYEGDGDALLRLLSNLLDNAVKYNREGGAVRVAFSREEDGAVIAVSDRGIGIAPVHLDRIFERFYRVDKGRARDEGGTGLGLAIVKHVAQAHEGRVEVESTLGEGSTFRVHLPG